MSKLHSLINPPRANSQETKSQAPSSQDPFELEPLKNLKMLASGNRDFSWEIIFPGKLVSGVTISLILGCHYLSTSLLYICRDTTYFASCRSLRLDLS